MVVERASCTATAFGASIKQTIRAPSGDFVPVVVNDNVIDIRHIWYEQAPPRYATMCSPFPAGVDIVRYDALRNVLSGRKCKIGPSDRPPLLK